jgi:hypothetical protein
MSPHTPPTVVREYIESADHLTNLEGAQDEHPMNGRS